MKIGHNGLSIFRDASPSSSTRRARAYKPASLPGAGRTYQLTALVILTSLLLSPRICARPAQNCACATSSVHRAGSNVAVLVSPFPIE